MSDYRVLLFYSTNYAIWTSKVLESQKVECKIIPVPRALSSDCGYCVRFLVSDEDRILALVNEHGIEFDRLEPYVA